MAHHEEETLERIFPRCRIRSPPPMDTAVLIDLSDENKPNTGVMATTHHHQYQSKRISHCRDAIDSDSDNVVHNSDHVLKPAFSAAVTPVTQQRHRHTALKYRTENVDPMRRSKTRRPRASDTWQHLYDTHGGGYEPSSDSEDGDSDAHTKSPSVKKGDKSVVGVGSIGIGSIGGIGISGGGGGVRPSASESQISLKKPERRIKEIYNLTPQEAQRNIAGETRLEIAGGREILSRSRTRTQRKVKKSGGGGPLLGGGGGGGGGRGDIIEDGDHMTNSNSTTASSSNRSINRYSGEVYYEESMGRYGFRVDGNTLWGSQGLEPCFSIPSSLNEKAAPPSETVLKRPLSWAGDDGPDNPETLDQYESHCSDPVEVEQSEDTHNQSTVTQNSSGAGGGIRCGYLTDFYPEMAACRPQSPNSGSTSGCSGTGGGPSLSLDNYLSEQLHQFTQSRKEPEAEEPEGDELEPVATSTTATVIGGLTIAQYEGSPRRYGLRPTQTNGHLENGVHSDGSEARETKKSSVKSESLSPRPGFPRRVAGSSGSNGTSTTFSPSTTRQTLVELTSSSVRPAGSISSSSSNNNLFVKDNVPSKFYKNAEADYNDTAWNLTEEPDVETDLGETDLGETEVGMEMGKSRNFTLSPETTDYHDSELDANDRDAQSDSPSGGGVVDPSAPTLPTSSTGQRDSGHKFPSMPILADGLSSGQNSASVSEGEGETDRVPLMNNAIHRRVVAAHARAYPHGPQTNGYLRMVPPTSGAGAGTGASASPGASLPPSALLSNAVQQLWVKKGTSSLDVGLDHETQGSFRK